MAPLERLPATISRHRAGAEVAFGIVVGVLLAAGTIAQAGGSAEGIGRGVTLGIGVGLGAWYIALRRRLEAELEDRRRIEARLDLARELHDTVAGQVAIIGIQAAAAQRVLADRPDEASAALERIEAASRAANADLRRMLVALRDGTAGEPAAASPGLAGLDDLVAAATADGLTVRSKVDAASHARVDAALGAAIYRIVQEALTNVVTHAGRVAVEVRVRVVDESVEVAVINEPGRSSGRGTGRDPGSGYGLVGMRERVTAFGGTLDAGPAAAGGFSLVVRLPLRTEVAR